MQVPLVWRGGGGTEDEEWGAWPAGGAGVRVMDAELLEEEEEDEEDGEDEGEDEDDDGDEDLDDDDDGDEDDDEEDDEDDEDEDEEEDEDEDEDEDEQDQHSLEVQPAAVTPAARPPPTHPTPPTASARDPLPGPPRLRARAAPDDPCACAQAAARGPGGRSLAGSVGFGVPWHWLGRREWSNSSNSL